DGVLDPRCAAPAKGKDGASFVFTTAFGAIERTPPAKIDENQPLAFSLDVREAGRAKLATIDTSSLTVTLDPPADVTVEVAGDGGADDEIDLAARAFVRKRISRAQQRRWSQGRGDERGDPVPHVPLRGASRGRRRCGRLRAPLGEHGMQGRPDLWALLAAPRA